MRPLSHWESQLRVSAHLEVGQHTENQHEEALAAVAAWMTRKDCELAMAGQCIFEATILYTHGDVVEGSLGVTSIGTGRGMLGFTPGPGRAPRSPSAALQACSLGWP